MTMTPTAGAAHARAHRPADRAPRPGVVQRLTEILDVFSNDHQRLLLDDVTTATGLPRSTAFRLLSQMVDQDWLRHDTTGYRLGPRALRMGRSGTDHTTLRGVAADVLNALHLRTGGVAHLAVLEGTNVHYLDKVGGSALRSIPSSVGARLPADTMPCGQAMLAALPRDRVDQLFVRDTDPRTLARLHLHLAHVRTQQGVASIPAEACQMSIATVAAPVVGPHGPVAAISVAVPNGPGVDDIAPLVATAARRIAHTLFPPRPR